MKKDKKLLDLVVDKIRVKHYSIKIENMSLNDTRFNLIITPKNDNNLTIYNISIQTKDDTTIRICSSISKEGL